ncbi:MAG: hypothetical protein GY931_17775 [Maribacter sp.]|nr:hypothetical protein [Maribacter sp.]
MALLIEHSAKRKSFTDAIFFFLLALLFGAFGLSMLERFPINEYQEVVFKILLIVISLFVLIMFYLSVKKIAAIFRISGNWRIYVNRERFRFTSPDPDETESFEYSMFDISGFVRKSYDSGDGISHRWILHVNNNNQATCLELNLGPFNPEVVIDYIQNNCPPHVRFTEVDLKGVERERRQTIERKFANYMSLIIVSVIFATFIIGAVKYWIHLFIK